jgi:hypothetical protein
MTGPRTRTVIRQTKVLQRIVILAAIAEWTAAAAFAQTVRVPGTKVSLVPPPGFSVAGQYPGFERKADQASIMVTELPTPAAEMIKAMTAPALATRGMALVSSQQAMIGGHSARLLNVRQKTPDGAVMKSMLIAGDRTMTIMIVGTVATDAPSSTITEIQRSLLSTTWGSAAPGAFEGLPFRVTPTPRLKLAQRVSNMVAFTESGTMGTRASPEALYLVGHSIGRGTLGDLRSFSEARAQQTTLTKDVGNFTGRAIQVDGLDAFELEADAIDTRSGAAMRIYQVIIPDDTGYFIAQGLVRADRAADLVSEFRVVTRSFRLNPDP